MSESTPAPIMQNSETRRKNDALAWAGTLGGTGVFFEMSGIAILLASKEPVDLVGLALAILGGFSMMGGGITYFKNRN